jgi:hypothetical protein
MDRDNAYSELMLRVAVRLPAPPGRIGDYLADVTALEAAGADSIWPVGASTEPWILLGAIAAVTHGVRLGVMLGGSGGSEAGWLDAIDALGRLSSGRVVVGMRPGRAPKARDEMKSQPSVLHLCRDAAEARRSVGAADGVILQCGEEEVRALRAQALDSELWVDMAVPADKAGWVSTIAAMEGAGATGVIVPWDSRLIDLLRSAGEPDDRTDLLIAAG